MLSPYFSALQNWHPIRLLYINTSDKYLVIKVDLMQQLQHLKKRSNSIQAMRQLTITWDLCLML
ncbi:hypothetical protein QUA54_33970 [Microcoleus sp. MOSTC5]